MNPPPPTDPSLAEFLLASIAAVIAMIALVRMYAG